ARAIAEKHLKENPLESVYESILIPALRLAEHDHQTDGLDDDARRFMFESTKELIEDLGDELTENPPAATTEDDARRQTAQAEIGGLNGNIACMPARSGADELVVMMLAQLLRRAGYRACDLKAGAIEDMAAAVSQQDCTIVCVSSLPPFASGQARSLCKRLQASLPGVPILLGLWNLEGGIPAARERLGPACSSMVTTTLADALEQIHRLADSGVAAETVKQKG
ncbi:MAG: hypothetical protein WB562_15785, partial [Candidatus Sulfotelmatobacter sp.]